MADAARKMVLLVTPAGEVQHTLKDSFFNTGFLGNRSVERMTEIRFDETRQKFYIVYINQDILSALGKHGYFEDCDGDYALFDTYEQAVEVEIDLVNQLRSQGVQINNVNTSNNKRC